MMCTRQRVIKVTGWLVGLALLAALAGYVFISLRIGAAVHATSEAAVRQYAGDRVQALLRCVEDARQPLRERNRAVWALGQLGDPRALSTLQKYHTGEPCNHQTALCQRELGKAIRLLTGSVNASAWVWRRGAEAGRPPS